MKFIAADGNTFTGRSYSDIVRQMADEKLSAPKSLESYRRATANRVGEMYGRPVDDSDDRSFVLSLEAQGMLERVT